MSNFRAIAILFLLFSLGCGGQAAESNTPTGEAVLIVVATPTLSAAAPISESEEAETAVLPTVAPVESVGQQEETTLTIVTAALTENYDYEGVTFQYNSELAQAISGEKIAAMAGAYGFGIDGPPLFYNGVPDFLRLTFDNEATSVHPPLVVIQPVRDGAGEIYTSYTEWDKERFGQLDQQLATQSDRVGITPEDQPFAQVAYLGFQNGSGVRQVRHIPRGLGIVDINNSNVFYTYEGLTTNGRYYVWLQFPVRASVLTDEPMALEDLENLYRRDDAYATYFANKMGQLDALAVTDFSPSLTMLDQMMATLFIPDDASTTTSLPLNAPDCINGGTFIADVTIPDGSPVVARESFIKTWRLRNSGTCHWTAAYELIPDGSSQIEYLSSERPFTAVAPGEEIDISVRLVAPALAGSYRADWQLYEPYDVTGISFPEPFGPRIYVEITVPESGQPDPPPQGNWQIYSYAFGDSANEAEANAQIGKIITFGDGAIQFGEQNCPNPNYQSRYIDPAIYLEQAYKISPEILYISNENIDVINTGCDVAGLSEIMRLSTVHSETLVINRDGIFYFLYEQ